MTPIIVTIICSFLGSSALFSFISFLIKRRDDRRDSKNADRQEIRTELKSIRELLQELKDQTDKNEKDNLRTQLLVLMADYPENTLELLECAEHYFCDMHGNWYLTPIFANFLEEHGIGKPEWLLNNK